MNKVSQVSPTKPILHSTIKFGGVPSAGMDVTIEANVQERDALAKRAGLQGIDYLRARLEVKQRGRELRVNGVLRADVIYNCVRTLELFTGRIDEKISVRFAPVRERDEKHIDLSFGDDAPEPLIDGRADLGTLIEEYLVLSIDPYPHKPSSDFVDRQEDAGSEKRTVLRPAT